MARRATWTGIFMVACVSMLTWAAGDGGDNGGGDDGGGVEGPAVAPERMVRGSEITDAKVVASMQKGIDYLLKQKKGDNFESKKWSSVPDGQLGGETGLVLYALLHAGDSLQDNSEYHSKLAWRGKELNPVVLWLEKNMPQDTYVAGFEALALTLLPKIPNEKPGEGPQQALDTCRYYMLGAMAQYGGYTYTKRPSAEVVAAAWQAYADDAIKGNRSGATRTALDQLLKGIRDSFGGMEVEIQKLATDLRLKAKLAKNAQEAARIAAEMKELDAYSKDLPESEDSGKKLQDLKRQLTQLQNLNGNPAGQTVPDPSTKKKRPMTKEELAAKIESLKTTIGELEKKEKTEFKAFGDLSNGQIGTLGAWTLADYGMELPDRYWEVQDRFWRTLQLPNGCWSYGTKNPDAAGKDTMGVAGIASLFIAQEFVDTELRLVPKPDKNIDAGLAWLNQNFKPNSNNYYYMYGVERVGLSSGLKFFGTQDWYKEGAANVVSRQNGDGSWTGAWNGNVCTSYALLFLARGRNPVVFNKLQYNGPWNARARDDAYVTRWLSKKKFEKPINWQIVNLQVSPEEWLDAPILLITGSQDPKFSKQDLDKLRAFVNAGGMIFSTSDGATAAFSTAMKNYASEIVGKKYEMRTLPRDHVLFSKELGVDMPNPPALMGLSNGVREIWIHSTADMGADWQTRKFASQSFEVAAALYLYASSKGSLRSKLQPLAVKAGSDQPERTIELARIDYPGNADPEPGAWARMAKLAKNDFKTQVNLSTVKFGQLDATKYPMAHLTGTTHVTFSDEDVKGLKAYLDGGGLLFADAAGGNAEFVASVRELLKKVYPEAAMEQVLSDSPLFTGTMKDGVKLEVEFRRFGNQRLNRRVTSPAMDELVVNGKTRALVSQWDICSGFLGTNTWGIVGYAPTTSQALARNILLYSLSQGQAPAAPAAKEKGVADPAN